MSKIDKDALVAELERRMGANKDFFKAGLITLETMTARDSQLLGIRHYLDSLPDEPEDVSASTMAPSCWSNDEYQVEPTSEDLEKAVEGEIIYNEFMCMLQPWCFVGNPFHVGDKVKVIVIKEDEL